MAGVHTPGQAAAAGPGIRAAERTSGQSRPGSEGGVTSERSLRHYWGHLCDVCHGKLWSLEAKCIDSGGAKA